MGKVLFLVEEKNRMRPRSVPVFLEVFGPVLEFFSGSIKTPENT
jgi:hypothetical protein